MEPVTLTQQQINDLRDLEAKHQQLGMEIERAKSAGLDMTEHEQMLNTMEGVRLGLLKVYGGTKRRKPVG